MKIIVFYVPYPTSEEARSVVVRALEQKLIACGNIVSSQSLYLWNQVLNEENEFIAILKTTSACVEKLTSFISDNHSDDLPAIVHWEVNVNEEYAAWVEKQTIQHQ